MQALATAPVSAKVPIIDPVRLDWMAKLVFMRARRTALLERLYREGAHLGPIDKQLHNARIDALKIFDRRIAELEASGIDIDA